jgi:hypothetical protein
VAQNRAVANPCPLPRACRSPKKEELLAQAYRAFHMVLYLKRLQNLRNQLTFY